MTYIGLLLKTVIKQLFFRTKEFYEKILTYPDQMVLNAPVGINSEDDDVILYIYYSNFKVTNKNSVTNNIIFIIFNYVTVGSWDEC